MVKDRQVRTLRQLLAQGWNLARSARRSGMDEKTARKYRVSEGLPSELASPRTWRTRPDPFGEVWAEVEARLVAEPRLRAYTLFGWLQDRYPGQFPESQRRTFERRVRQWRGSRGPGRTVIFPQVHSPGDLAASDFTHMSSLGVTIAGQPFPHLLFHFTLTYSNWEFVRICFSESFEALSQGLQAAFWELGGVPRRHRSDSLTAAVNNLSENREFQSRYRELVDHYRVRPERINVRQAHENGDVESSHGHLKTAIDQALLLRGSRDFASREEYEHFLLAVVEKRNLGRGDKPSEERLLLGELPPGKLDHRQYIHAIRVQRSSTIQVKRNTYSVPSRLIGHEVDVVIDADAIEVRYAGELVQRMPRLLGSGKHAVNYRHVIDSLVRKPGAFKDYQYREDMFPTSYFRMAYDQLCSHHAPRAAAREYLKILHLAAR
ncbi:MAG: IS21 family transposase, partial [Phycisphaerae bacterium]|nr:IS21 family transposase [Phycisphaerae bacterium]